MRPVVRSFATALTLAAAMLGGSAVLVGCDDPRSVDWQVKHVADSNPLDRGKALDGIAQNWRTIDQSNDDKKKKEFRDKAIPELTKAYLADTLKDSTKDRKKIMDILSQADDVRAKPAFVHAFKNYKPGDNDEEVKSAARAVLKNRKAFEGKDADDLGKALVEGIDKTKFADPKSGEIGALLGDAISAIKPKGIVSELLAIIRRPNDGALTVANKELTARQALCASAIGDVGDAKIVPDLVKLMFELASKMAISKDQTGQDVEKASPLTTGVSMLIGGSLAKIGAPAIPVLMPYVKDDLSNADVKATKEMFKKYIGPTGSQPNAYVNIATSTVANIGLPEVSTEIAKMVKDKAAEKKSKDDKKTKEDELRPLVTLLIMLPSSPETMDALKDAYTAAPKLRMEIALSMMRLMDPDVTDWLLKAATEKGVDDDTRDMALNSALFLAKKEKLPEVIALYDKAKLLDKPDKNNWSIKEPTTTACDKKTFKDTEKEQCFEPADAKPGETKTVIWKDITPKHRDVHKIVLDLVNKCEAKPECYFEEFKDAVKVVDKMGLTKMTLEGVLGGIRAQKAIWMLAALGTEKDMVILVNYMPMIEAPNMRAFVQFALDRNLKSGSVKVADAIAELVRGQRKKGSETANREAGQLEPIANKLRARAASAKK